MICKGWQMERHEMRRNIWLWNAAQSLLIVAFIFDALVISQEPNQNLPQANLEDGYQPLFDNESLKGWEGNRDWFRVEDGAVVAGSLTRPIPHNEFLCTERQYTNFELRLEARLKGSGDNAGVQFRTLRIPDSTEVSGYQCDIGSAWNRPVWGGLYDESRRNKMLAEGDPKVVVGALKTGDWNELMVRAVDNHIQIWLNRSLTVEFTETDPKIAKSGVIALQIHSGPPTEAWYRNIRIRELPSSQR